MKRIVDRLQQSEQMCVLLNNSLRETPLLRNFIKKFINDNLRIGVIHRSITLRISAK